jgi:transposase-like protein
MERRKFTREFKLEAVRLIKDRGVSYVQASLDLNVHPSQLRDWVKKFSEDPQPASLPFAQTLIGDFSRRREGFRARRVKLTRPEPWIDLSVARN